MAKDPASKDTDKAPVCRLCDRPATQLVHPEHKTLNHKSLKELRQPAMLRRFSNSAVCDSHIESWSSVDGINSGHIPDPKADTSCKFCGQTMKNSEKDAHDNLHQTKRDFDAENKKKETEAAIEHFHQSVQKHFDDHNEKIQNLRNINMKLTHLSDQLLGKFEEISRKDDPKTGENYDEHY